MTKFFTLIVMAFAGVYSFAQGPYEPAAGINGSSAIHKDSSVYKTWATGIELKPGLINISDHAAQYNGSSYASFGAPGLALGKAQDSAFHVVSLGDGGTATLTFDKSIRNGIGPDFAVFENSFSDGYLELAFVEVSSDGKRFVRFPAVSLTKAESQVGGFSTIDPTNIHNLAGKYKIAYGTPFDLEDIKDSANIDLDNIRFVHIRDAVGSINKDYASYDSKGNIINEPWPTAFHSGGFDLEAVGVINAGKIFFISTFDELSLKEDTFWNGADKSGGFSSGIAYFKNEYNESWGSWSGFAYSNMRNDSTPGYENQYSAITGGGLNAGIDGGTNYVTAYYSSFASNFVSFKDNKDYVVNGLYVTNSAYAYLSMKDGDAFSKKFGGADGTDPDYFKLSFWGEKPDSTFTDTVEVYLADFRSADSTKDYILDSWKWVDLEKLGKVRKIHFALSSTDNGDWGMNTPSYFCLDNLSVQTGESEPVNIEPVKSNSISLKVYPNPFVSNVHVAGGKGSVLGIYNLSGHLLLKTRLDSDQENISLNHLSKGVYFLRIQGKENWVEKIIKK